MTPSVTTSRRNVVQLGAAVGATAFLVDVCMVIGEGALPRGHGSSQRMREPNRVPVLACAIAQIHVNLESA
jgi:hypothetical protein